MRGNRCTSREYSLLFLSSIHETRNNPDQTLEKHCGQTIAFKFIETENNFSVELIVVKGTNRNHWGLWST